MLGDQDSPYLPPSAAPGPPRGRRERGESAAPFFRSPRLLGRWTVWLLGVTAAAAALGAMSGVMQVQLMEHPYTREAALANDLRQARIVGALAVAHLATTVLFLMWFFRVTRNLPALGNRHVSHGPGWAVGGFFVPFLNLVRPYQVMVQAWTLSDPAAWMAQRAHDLKRLRATQETPALVLAWWLVFLAGGIVAEIGVFAAAGSAPHTVEELRFISGWQVFNDLWTILSAVFAILVVRRVTAFQDERDRLIAEDVPDAVVATDMKAASEPAPAP